VAVTGAGGRLGSALVAVLREADGDGEGDGATAIAWRRPDYDLDMTDPGALLNRDRPSLVIHAAAWTDVDGCARDPALAMRRNAEAVGELARACAARGVGLLHFSTNEVFNGERIDLVGYSESDPPNPTNGYGKSKFAGEELARAAFGSAPGLWIIRTAWLYGPPGNDFPTKILAASDARGDGEPLPVVADEWGTPTFAHDLARAAIDLAGAVDGGLFHLVGSGGIASRHDWAKAVLDRCRPGRSLVATSQRDFARASVPPPWGVLDSTRAAVEAGVVLRDWRAALEDYLETIC
jgi:dTDP-4-dehydrorhamnose reductase